MRTFDVMLLSAGGMSVVMLGVLATLLRTDVRGIREWLAANALALLAYLLYSVGWKYQPFLAVEAANFLYGTTAILVAAGFRRFFGKPPHYLPLFAALCVVVSALAAMHYLVDLPHARIILISLFHGAIAWLIFKTLRSAAEVETSYYPLLFARILAVALMLAVILRIAMQAEYVVNRTLHLPLDFHGPDIVLLSLGILLLPALTLVGASLTTSRLVRMARQEAKTDFLTGTWSRRAPMEFADRELERADRTGRPLALLLLDVDDFKRINDSYGHPAGDSVLIELALKASGAVRSIDYVCRLGGDEFAVLLPDTDAQTAIGVAGRLLQSIAAPQAGRINYTVSIGVAAHETGCGWQDLYNAADNALSQAKLLGKNRAVASRKAASAINPPGASANPDRR